MVAFYHILTWISHMCICVPPSWNHLPAPSPTQPSGLSLSASFECPASCMEHVLVICFTYGNIHVLMLFSQIIPPHLLAHSPRVCSLLLCLFCCLAYRIITVFLNSIYMHSYTVFGFLFLTYFTLYNRLQLHPPH